MVSPGTPLRCLIVDDSPAFVQAAARILEFQGLSVVGTVTTIAEALRGVEELRPDVTLVDVYLGEEDGFDLAERLDRNGCSPHTAVILTSANDPEEFKELLAASPAMGFLPKHALSADAIRDLLAR
jgi:DNA-binding NarL/FixJ family response regulator